MSAQHNFGLADIKEALRNGPYAWPGGYPMYFVASDGDPLSFEAVRECWREVVGAHLDYASYLREHSGWRIVGVDVNWEDPDLYCAHSNERIESAYAEPEEEEVA
jgi:hypothetical protein